MKQISVLLGAFIHLFCSSIGSAQTVVAPNAYTSTLSGTSGLNTFIRDINAPRTGQLLVNENQLTSIPAGSQITGISFRMYSANTTGFPATDATWSDYTINIGTGVAFGSQTTTFASNFASTPTTVRSGPLTVTAGSYTGGSNPNPNPFGTPIDFSTPYTYNGGNLLLEIRHTGSNITNPANSFLEAVATTNPEYNVNYWGATATGFDATTGAQSTFTVTQFHFTPVPEPTSLLGCATIAFGSAITIIRRRRAAKMADA